MGSTTVRVSTATWRLLRELAKEANIPMQEVLQGALEDYRRKQILDQANNAYQKLRDSTTGWAEEVAERREWERTLADGQEND